ncbi:type II secretion system minor pseudopilin GspI [Pseudomonas sp. LD120]|uniref:type II secretion system minor pseudopilin GspI n=1 Tax=Pseudomonas sp. LD120 TaxID=485751 RepID=UPI0021150C67|nr:type II secretion system minor pseudopilin GspI [Pseudomonas sp. LD120]
MKPTTEQGFTLLEVMVALAIFATLSIALFSAVQHIAINSANLAERTQAAWIADNRMNELRAALRTATTGRDEERIEFGGRRWWLFSTVEAAADARLLQVELRVSAETDPQRARQYSRARLLGYIEATP